MSSFKLFWNLHKWTGIVLALVLAVVATTGLLLILKKDFDALQPPTQRGTEGGVEELASLQDVLGAVFAQGHPELRSIDDVDRIDFRPGKRVHKVRSVRGFVEFQVDATTAEILSGPSYRASDLIESIHDGSFVAEWFHGWVMPATAIGLLFLIGSGLWLWVEPKLRRRRRNRRRAQAA